MQNPPVSPCSVRQNFLFALSLNRGQSQGDHPGLHEGVKRRYWGGAGTCRFQKGTAFQHFHACRDVRCTRCSSFWWCESLSFKICCFFSGQGWWSDHDDVGQCLRAPSQVFRYFSEERKWKMFKLTLTEFTESQNDTKERTELKHSQKQCQVFNRKMVLVIKAHWNYLGGDLRKCNFGSMGFMQLWYELYGVVQLWTSVNCVILCLL